MSKKPFLLISFTLLCFTLALGQETSADTLSLEVQRSLEAKGFKVLGLAPKLVSPRQDSLAEGKQIKRISVSFDLSTSGIKPFWMGRPKRSVSSQAAIDTIMTDGFEGEFPGTKWQRSGDPTWGKTDYKKHAGSYSIWCAKDETNGVEPGQSYPDSCQSMMIYGPFDLSDVNHAELYFWHWLDIEYEKDWFFSMGSTDGINFSGIGLSGQTGFWAGNWRDETLFLSNIPDLGNVTGKNKVWIAFSFISDDHATNDQGVYLDEVVLTKRQVAGTPIVSGISGKLTPAGNPYIAVNDVGVPEGDSLIIEPGVEIRFEKQVAFFVNGLLKAVGTKLDSIVFTSNEPTPKCGDWGGIHISSSDSCEMQFCRISYSGHHVFSWLSAGGGILCHKGNIFIKNSRISNNCGNSWNGGILCLGGNVTIDSNLITDNEIGIYVSSSTALIIRNMIRNNKGSGIRTVYSYLNIQYNTIKENSYGINGGTGGIIFRNKISRNNLGGISIGGRSFYGGTGSWSIANNEILSNGYNGLGIGVGGSEFLEAIITNNVIADNEGVGISSANAKNMFIINNTIAKNRESGILVKDYFLELHTVVLLNNIIFSNKIAGIQSEPKKCLKVMYNNIFENGIKFDLICSDSLGILTKKNINGDSCDTNFNIMMDPLFVYPDTNNYNLQGRSPCINAGNPNVFFNDIDGSVNDMGATGGSSIYISFSDFDFDSVEVGLTKTKNLLISNTRESEFKIKNLLLSDSVHYSISQNAPLTILPFHSKQIKITFKPQEVGYFSCSLIIQSDDFVGASSAMVSLHGQGYWAGTVVGGNMRGIWERSRSPYIVKSDIFICKNDTLLISPGVLVKFTGLFGIKVEGTLISVGTSQDSIIYDYYYPEDSKGWRGIHFKDNMTISKIEYCKIQHTYDPHMVGVVCGIFCESSSPIISSNTIANCYSRQSASAIECKAKSSPIISNNFIYNNSSNNPAIYCYDDSSPIILNNIIVQNECSEGAICCNNSKPIIINNVIYKDKGIKISNCSNLFIINNIIRENTRWDKKQIVFYNSDSANFIYNNVQGDSQGGNNIDVNPLFVDPEDLDFHLQPNSPCIDAGHPDSVYNDFEDPNNPGYALYPALGTIRNDMGAYGGPGAANWGVATAVESETEDLVSLPKSFELLQNYPNPFNPGTTIKYQLPKSTEVSLKIYNLLGQLVKTLVDEKQAAGHYTVRWDGRDNNRRQVASGVYFVSLRTKHFVKSNKMIIMR